MPLLLYQANRLPTVVVLELGLGVLLEENAKNFLHHNLLCSKDRRSVRLHTFVLFFFFLIGIKILTYLLLMERVVRAVRKGTGGFTAEESSMDKDLRSSDLDGEHTFNAFWLNHFRVAPDLYVYL